jgi:outer membrane protein assembly factor BamB
MPESRDAIYIGIRGTVLALDRSRGVEIWRADLKGSDFVNVVLDGDRVLAATKGEVFCLDSTTGKILWNNELKGLGRGLMTVVTANSGAFPLLIAVSPFRLLLPPRLSPPALRSGLQ